MSLAIRNRTNGSTGVNIFRGALGGGGGGCLYILYAPPPPPHTLTTSPQSHHSALQSPPHHKVIPETTLCSLGTFHATTMHIYPYI